MNTGIDDDEAATSDKTELSAEALNAQLRVLVGQGLSLAEIRAALGVSMTRQGLHKRVQALGLVLAGRQIGAARPDSPRIGRPVSGAEMAKYLRPARERDEAWLSVFRSELNELLDSRQLTYAELWDELRRRHPFVPQLAAITTAREKSLRLSVWVSRERKKAKGKDASK